MELDLAVLPEDGVGPAVRTRAHNVLQGVGGKFGQHLNFNEVLIDAVAIDIEGKALSYETSGMIVGYARAGLDRSIVLDVPRPSRGGE